MQTLRHFYRFVFSYIATIASLPILAQPTTEHIKIDQFGYRPSDQKIAVIADPQIGHNSNESYQPGEVLEIRELVSGNVAFTGNPVAWKSGAIHSQSGDKVWWFDFSDLQTPGQYVVYDPTNNRKSFSFQIDADIYSLVLKHAMRAFYYQRCGTPKEAVFAGEKWADPVACHVHGGQDQDCRAVITPNDAGSARQVSGGWHDAGDFNKYVNFTYSPVHDLLFAYQENPTVFTDDYGIPESGNDIPDILDEVKWELDWLRKMQLADGQSLMEISVTAHQIGSPPSTDEANRYYGEASASATRTLASIFAHASIVFSNVPGMSTYADTLETAAIKAWDWLENNPGFSTYANTGFANVNPERNEYDQQSTQTCAAVFLFELTGETKFREYFDERYTSLHPYEWGFWYPFESMYQSIMLYYTSLPDATPEVKNNILTSYKNSVLSGNAELIPAVNNQTDAYRAYLKDDNYVWGSNLVKSQTGSLIYAMNLYQPAEETVNFTAIAADYLHFLHGINPFSWVMLTNMREYGADKSVNEMYHGWFWDGTIYDNAQNSPNGPAPGFVTGGINRQYRPDASYSGPALSPPLDQPVQKAYRDWNTSWPENSWEITEPAIYYQAGYVRLLSKFATGTLPEMPIISGFAPLPYQPLQIAPNPCQGKVHIYGPGNQLFQVFTLTNVEGKSSRITLKPQKGNANQYVLAIPESVAPGLYILSTYNQKGEVYRGKIMLER